MFAEQYDSAQTFILDRPNEPFRKCVQVWTSWRQFDRLDPTALQDPIERTGVKRIAIMDEVGGISEEAVDVLRACSNTLGCAEV